MNKAKTKSTFTDFFKEDAATIKDILKEGSSKQTEEMTGFTPDFPSLPKVAPAAEDELKAWWRNLRTFFRSGKGGGISKASVYPALLAPYRNQPQGRSDYPLWLADEKVIEDKYPDTHCASLAQLITNTIDSFAGEEEAIVLRTSVDRLVEITRNRIGTEPQLFETVIGDILADLVKQTDVRGDDGAAFAEDLKKLEGKLPKTGVLIPFSATAVYQIMGAALGAEQGARRNEMKHDIFILRAKLKDILSVETEKRPEGKKPEKLKSSYDFADSFLNFDELSNALPESGSELMAEDRFKRIEGVLKTLEGANSVLNAASVIIQQELYADKSIAWKDIFSGSEIKAVAKGKMCIEAGTVFERNMKVIAGTIAALRIGRLEVEGRYNHEVHADYFAGFDWQSFTDKEMAACPPVILIADVTAIVDAELSDFSHMLSSNTTIKILAVKKDACVDFRMNGATQSDDFVYRQELGSLTVSHRNTYTMQSTPVSPTDMFDGFSKGLASFSPALFYILTPSEKTSADPYLWASAAVEGREFPGFTYEGGLDSKWGSRFNITNNPQPDKDWPIYELKVKGAKTMNVAFTFADFAAQDSQYSHFLQVVPPQYWSDDLIEIADYLNIEGDEKYAKVPFIWMMDDENTLQKAAVSWPLVLACRERLDFWQHIQENGGVNSYHVEKAMEESREELKAEAEKEIDSLKEEHAKEIEQVKDETAGQAMEKLTAMLLDLDSAALVSAPSETPTAAPEAAATETSEDTPTTEEAPVEAETDLMTSEVYIETLLCTTCDECTDLNKNIFAYNDEKLAIVANPTGGPFVDIVEAAELCPVSIIHPGTPQDQSESGLDELVERAEKYN